MKNKQRLCCHNVARTILLTKQAEQVRIYATDVQAARRRQSTPDKKNFCKGLPYRTNEDAPILRLARPDKKKFCEGLPYRPNEDAPILRLARPITTKKQYAKISIMITFCESIWTANILGVPVGDAINSKDDWTLPWWWLMLLLSRSSAPT